MNQASRLTIVAKMNVRRERMKKEEGGRRKEEREVGWQRMCDGGRWKVEEDGRELLMQ